MAYSGHALMSVSAIPLNAAWTRESIDMEFERASVERSLPHRLFVRA